ncbi:MAG: type II secretion system inner membrane protein GspF [Dokdonella sp.]|uniref:type II secretion system inner membrane protein GspF n=1 Tax=Dokdonella sp. TaxID=2291710 RepID=UPI002BED027A|nr:type II secretion system inner membrane protein GspF [Dokdonella sp.]HOX70636.1 type II secretion system inner membrane protein GspF [Dokdonella sp.]HOX71904.1 type II secretion system inner membrane protein GspF [Dokdonella sp.]HPG93300.1 type II secretion system inner membrane protein GspF [Dokdonella sp.]HPN78885.1 type II secretion system inner membrane protein GspF [Dokdonella sp.]
MPAFAYQALDSNGKTQRGVLQGDTARAVRGILRERGLNPLAVDAVADDRQTASPFARRGLSGSQLAMLTRQLSTLVGAELPIDEALAALSEQDDNERQRALTVALRARVMEGASLAQAMGDFPDSFPEIFRATVAAGEQSGHLGVVLDKLADYAEARDALKQKLLGALTYPLLLSVVAIAVVAGLLTWVVPQIVGVFENMQQTLPFATRVLMSLSDFLRNWAWLLVVVLVIAAVVIRLALRREIVRYRWHQTLLRLPLIGRLTRAANTARAARTLALLAGAAVPLLDALAIAAQVVPNLPMRESLRLAAFKVREGSGFARALAESRQFPPVALRLIASGERSGELPRMLDEAARQQQRDLDRWLGVLSATLGPAVILLVGAMVLFIVLAILLPIFDLNQMVK